MVLASSLPMISISFAPPEDPIVEPFSPFPKVNVLVNDDNDGFRPKHLTPPPTHTKFSTFLPSPLRGSANESAGKGLERDRFEALLRATKERNSAAGTKKGSDLRKEIALKAHKNKQAERRALFLSKVLAPPSPTATSLPKTPPESPAIFHYSLPSPGLVSPLALFESLHDASSGPLTYARQPWIEQVDYHRPSQAKENVPVNTRARDGAKQAKAFPSLDQISARLTGHQRTPSTESKRSSRLPSFLAQSRVSEAVERPRLAVGVGRLQVSIQSPKPSKAEHASILPPPKSPISPLIPQIQITTTVVPRSSSSSPTKLSELNVKALDMRERKAQNMLCTLKRRMAPSETGVGGNDEQEIEERKFRRHSAPAEMAARPRGGFEHPVLKLPGGF
ncbi:hypothetical protein AAF712_001079 [Marasmius tenuissimus]|uniref:Uncharacterized protein n=1 Tax=Marasmius tenuissimus TaxID=585030 RepID=A0ABR3AE07_9AGAR